MKNIHQIGDKITVSVIGTQDVYILAQLPNNKVCAINIASGGRYSDPVKVVDSSHITSPELENILDNDARYFDDSEVLRA